MTGDRYVYLVEARPVNDAGVEVPQYWSAGQRSGQPYGGIQWVNCLLGDYGPFTYSTEIALDTTVGGRVVSGYGALRLDMQFLDDGAMTLLVALHWDARPLRIWRVLEGTAVVSIEDEPPIFTGTTDTPSFGVAVATVPLFDRSRLLDVPLQETTYLGTGLLEGHADLTGVRKPLGIGRVTHVEPIALDHTPEGQPRPDGLNDSPFSRVVQFNDGAVDIVLTPAIYERGLLFGVNTSGSDVYAWPPVGGAVEWDYARGVARTGSVPIGVLTVLYWGNPGGRIPVSGLGIGIYTHGNVIASVLAHRADVDIEPASGVLDALDTALGDNEAGIFVQDDRTIAAVLDALAESAGAAWCVLPDGSFTIRQIGFRASVAVLTATDFLDELRPIALPPPVWRLNVRHTPVERALTDSDIGAAQILDGDRTLLSEPYRTSIHESSTVKTIRPLARESETFIRSGGSVLDWERRARLLRRNRQGYAVTVRRAFNTFREGDTVTLRYSGFGLDAGKDFLIRAKTERPSILPDEDAVELTLWGPFIPGEDTRLAA